MLNLVLTLNFLYYTSYVWLPALLLFLLWELWIDYKHAQFFAKQIHVVLEIKLPREIFKSPQATEFFISALHQTGGEANWYEKYWKGSVRPWFSLEIFSIGGAVHFFVWTHKGSKTQIEANLYSQFPGIEIYEVPDYTLPIVYNPEVNEMWASEFKLTKPDAFPIKTYVDYGMDKNPKEEFKIDPITPLIEFFGSLGRGHQAGVQIIVRAHKAEDRDPITGELVDLKWSKGAQKEIDDIYKKVKGEKGEDGKIISGTGRPLSDIESETVKALSRSISKKGFDVGIRALYTASKDIFDASNIGGIIGGVTHFNSNLNGFAPTGGVASKHKYLLWKDRSPKKVWKEKQYLLDAYKHRAYFYKPFKKPYFVLNAEELATMYHFPGGVAGTPTFSRIGSKKAEAPANIPI